jgi:HEAT repeat protein
MESVRTSTIGRWGVAAAAGAVCALAGCSTMGQDFGELGAALTPTTPSQAARMMMDPYDPDNRRKGTALIANSPFGGADPYLAVYRDMVVNEPDPLARAEAIEALGRYGGPQDVPAIAANLDSAHFQVRWAAAKALQRIHNPAAVGPLLRVLLNPEEQHDIRVSCAVALGQYPQDRVFQGLVGALDARQLAINAAARESLETLTGQHFGLNPKPWLAWYNATDKPFADQQQYLYPTYKREETFLEKLVFWSKKTYEQPSPPAGADTSVRRTYQDEKGPADEAGG